MGTTDDHVEHLDTDQQGSNFDDLLFAGQSLNSEAPDDSAILHGDLTLDLFPPTSARPLNEFGNAVSTAHFIGLIEQC